jgi:hypothetical protein
LRRLIRTTPAAIAAIAAITASTMTVQPHEGIPGDDPGWPPPPPVEEVNVTDWPDAVPVTVTLPEDGLTVYPGVSPTEYTVVPFVAANTIVSVVELR